MHRRAGRVYATAALVAGAGGLAFIAVKGTIGGPAMDVGFGLYGALMIVATVQTVRHARAGRSDPRRLTTRRVWAVRLFALVIGSWLYHMDYGFWMPLADGAGHAPDFRGPFDAVMAFFFYVPNLVVVDACTRARPQRRAGAPPDRRQRARRCDGVPAARHVLLHEAVLGARDPGAAVGPIN